MLDFGKFIIKQDATELLYSFVLLLLSYRLSKPKIKMKFLCRIQRSDPFYFRQ
jgi:hypothetical protein